MATLGTMAAIGAFSLGGSKKAKAEGPPTNATSKDEEAFIQYVKSSTIYGGKEIFQTLMYAGAREFIKNANAEEQKAKH